MAREITVLKELPSLGPLIGKALLPGRRPSPAEGVPQRSVVVADMAITPERLAAYDRVCGFSLSDRVPATFLHVLTFPLQAHLMASSDFPFPLAGIVHVTNEMTLHRPVSLTQRLRLGVHAQHPRPHRKGVTFDMVGEIHAGDELVWRGVSTYLSTAAELAGEPVATEREPVADVVAAQQWVLAADLGRRYAAVSGDVNPIHLHPLTARPFGFARPIIHGMWTHARALAAFAGALPEAYRVRVQFTKPIALPGRAWFGAETADDGKLRFAVTNPDHKPYLAGSLVPIG
ncbi:MAG: MaoC/PaaZ C-terminal domain-containing protein [Arachnia sp.]